LVTHWGYLAVALGTFLEGETVLLLAGALAHRGLLSLPLVILVAFAGSVAGDQLWFFIGRRYGAGLVAKSAVIRQRTSAVQTWLGRWGSWFVLGFRFIYGLRTVAPLLVGAARFPAGRFAVLNLVGAAAWSGLVTSLGYGAGAGIRAISGRATRLEEATALAVMMTLVLVLITRRKLRKHRGPAARDVDQTTRKT
jgi:membrane protein DedA with SNARE-associated domain